MAWHDAMLRVPYYVATQGFPGNDKDFRGAPQGERLPARATGLPVLLQHGLRGGDAASNQLDYI